MLRWACKIAVSLSPLILVSGVDELQLSIAFCPGSDQLQGSHKTRQIKKSWQKRWRRRTLRWTWCCSKCRWCCPTPVVALCCAIWVRMEAPPAAFASRWPASTRLHCWVSLPCSSSSSRSHHYQHFDSSAANLLWFETGILECVVLLLTCCGLRQEFWNALWLRTMSVHPEMTVWLTGCKNLITYQLPVVMKQILPQCPTKPVMSISGMCAFNSASGSTFNGKLIDGFLMLRAKVIWGWRSVYQITCVWFAAHVTVLKEDVKKNEVDWTRMAEVTRQISWQGLKHAKLYSGLLLALKRAPLIDLDSQQRWD